MKKRSIDPGGPNYLRLKAEEQLKIRKTKPNKMVSDTDLLKLIQELEVHQIELEMQNEELAIAKEKAEIAEEKYTELYDFAPSGYFTLSPRGDILELNLHGAQMLGNERIHLIKSQFSLFIRADSRSVFKNFLGEIFQGKSNAICDVPLTCKDNHELYVHLTGIISDDKKRCHVTVIDITERKKAEDDLRKNLAKYKVLINTFPIAITISDKAGNIIETNEKALELLGLSREEHLKRKLKGEEWKIIKTDGTIFPQDEYASVKALNENRLVENVEMGIVKHGDEITWLNVTSAPIPIEEFGVIIAYNDITLRRQMENELIEARKKAEESEARFRNLMENIDTVAVQGYGPDGITQFWNKASEKLYGYTQQEAIGTKLLDLIIPSEMKDEVAKAIIEMARTGEPIPSGELLLKHKDGSSVPVISHHAIVRVPGHVQELFCLDIDISERKILENELKISEERFSLVIDASEQGIWDWNVETNEVFFSEQWKRQIGYEVDEINNVFDSWIEHLHPEERNSCQNAVQTYLNNPVKYFVLEFRFRDKDGSYRWIYNKASSILNKDGKVTRMYGAHTDITDRKKAELQIKYQNEELQKLNATKDKFFSIIAHDLKSPFNSIMGFSELLIEQISEKDFDKLEKYARTILQSSEHVVHLLMNLTDWSRSQSGRMEFNPEKFGITELINDIILLFEVIAAQKGITIKREVPQNVQVFADKAMINTVLRNLISNAIKFTKPGGEIVVAATEEKDKLTVVIKDNGIGIPHESINKLFRIDENFSTSGTASEEGTGLGLILCKEFVEKHNGIIWVESEEGKGSMFYFTLFYNTESGI